LLRQGDPQKFKLGDEALQKLHQLIEKISTEIQGKDYWKYHRAFSPGLQEYIEAISLFHWLRTGSLIHKVDIEQRLQLDNSQRGFFPISDEDYLLGIADLSGELMRLAISTSTAGEQSTSARISEFLKALYHGFEAMGSGVYGLETKVKVMESSVLKVEAVCFSSQAQAGEALLSSAE